MKTLLEEAGVQPVAPPEEADEEEEVEEVEVEVVEVEAPTPSKKRKEPWNHNQWSRKEARYQEKRRFWNSGLEPNNQKL